MEALQALPIREHSFRQEVIREAMTWIGTKFQHETCIKGVSADCGRFPLAVFAACGFESLRDYKPPHVPIQWHMHKDSPTFDPEMYVRQILLFTEEVSRPYPADIAMFWWGHAYAHTAIVIDWPTKAIHCTEPNGVTLVDPSRDPAARKWRGVHPARFFSVWRSA
jgi:hypothetical protein